MFGDVVGRQRHRRDAPRQLARVDLVRRVRRRVVVVEVRRALHLQPEAHDAVLLELADVRAGDMVVCGYEGIKVAPLERPRGGNAATFTFMSSEVSSEKPQGLMVQRIADLMRQMKGDGKKILWVLGPAVVHTGSVEAFCALIRSGWVDVVFAGNQRIDTAVLQEKVDVKLGQVYNPVDVTRSAERLKEHSLTLTATLEALAALADLGYDAEFGARPLRRVIQQKVEDPLSDLVLSGEFGQGSSVLVDVNEEGEIILTRSGEKEEKAAAPAA